MFSKWSYISSGRRVVVALYLVAHHLDLLLNLGLRVCAVQHYVREQVDGARQVLAQDGRVEHRVLLVGEGVEVAPHPLRQFSICKDVRRAVPLNVVCSQKWARPSSPGSSSRVPAPTA